MLQESCKQHQWSRANISPVLRLLLRGLWNRCALRTHLSEPLPIALCLRLCLGSEERVPWWRFCVARCQLLDRLSPFATFWASLSWCLARNGDEGMLLSILASLPLGSHLPSWAPARLSLLSNLQVFGRKRQGVELFFWLPPSLIHRLWCSCFCLCVRPRTL
jgi:hypothetical protein